MGCVKNTQIESGKFEIYLCEMYMEFENFEKLKMFEFGYM